METSTDFGALLADHQYAVVDRLNVFLAPWTQAAPMVPLVPRELRGNAEDMPALLAIDPEADWFPNLLEEFATSEKRGAPPPFRNLLVVPEEVDPELLAEHLTERLILHFPEGKAYLRYFDPKNFVHLKRFLRPVELQALYGPVIRWSIYFDDRWITEFEPGITENVPLHWGVNARQFAALERLRVVNQALFYWRKQLGRPWKNLDEFCAYADQADAMADREQRTQPDERDETIVRAVRHQFPQNFHLERNQFQYKGLSS